MNKTYCFQKTWNLIMKKLKIKYLHDGSVRGFAIEVEQTDGLARIKSKIKSYVKKHFNILVNNKQMQIPAMNNSMSVKDLSTSLIEVIQEVIPEYITDEIAEYECKICFFYKQHPYDQCSLCGFCQGHIEFMTS